MLNCYTLFTLLTYLRIVVVVVVVSATTSDFCQLETFYANCSRGSAVKPPEVAVVRSALYGRMRLGRCVRRDYGHVGCTADVRAEVDAMCSGRLGGCRFTVARLNPRQPCPGDLTPYLQVAYDCLPGKLSWTAADTFLKDKGKGVHLYSASL